ncbi:hypothetical protein [Halorubrum sp. F4]|uniref:hypothetical protein n=1 Tax=Halorubrum sp. F4 TaxID=2989715 RepID=UPI002480DA2F|nr:hypothetical protein [Halorubrum sp. F4]
MNDSRTSDADPNPDADPDRPPRYEQVIRWAEYIKTHPPEVWGPQQNAVVNGQLESAKAVDVSAEERERVREFADDVLRAEREGDEDEPERDEE